MPNGKGVQNPKTKIQSPKSKVQSPKSGDWRILLRKHAATEENQVKQNHGGKIMSEGVTEERGTERSEPQRRSAENRNQNRNLPQEDAENTKILTTDGHRSNQNNTRYAHSWASRILRETEQTERQKDLVGLR